MLPSSGVNDSPQSEEQHRPQGGWACSAALWDSFCKDKKSTACLILFDGAWQWCCCYTVNTSCWTLNEWTALLLSSRSFNFFDLFSWHIKLHGFNCGAPHHAWVDNTYSFQCCIWQALGSRKTWLEKDTSSFILDYFNHKFCLSPADLFYCKDVLK